MRTLPFLRMKSFSVVSSGEKKVSPESRLMSRFLSNSPLRSSSESGSRVSALERTCTSSSSGIIFLSLLLLLWRAHLYLSVDNLSVDIRIRFSAALFFRRGTPLDLHRFRGLFETENGARKGEHCHEQSRPTPRSFAEKLSGWLELPMRSTLSPGSPARSVSPTVPFGVGSTKMRSTAASEKG